MKKNLRRILPVLCILFLAQSAFALGLGFYGTVGGGWNKYYEYEGNLTGGTFNVGGGLTLDTCLAMDRIFNYRLNVGVEYLSTPAPYIKLDWTRVHVVNTFGFGVVRNKNIRFWLGPEIIFGPFFGSNRWGATAGMGLAFGLNINIGKTITLAFTLSGRFEGGYREYTVTKILEEDINMYRLTGNTFLLMPDEYRMMAGGITVYGQFSISIMFRVMDTYGR